MSLRLKTLDNGSKEQIYQCIWVKDPLVKVVLGLMVLPPPISLGALWGLGLALLFAWNC